MNSELYDSIIKVFKETGSVLDTAHRLNTYPIKVRRVLITEGLWSSKSSRTIAKLLDEGKKVYEIAEELDMTEKNVQAYMPYSKGEYGKPDKSQDAINTENYRERNRHIVEKQKVARRTTDRESIFAPPIKHSKKSIMKLHLELTIDKQYLPVLRKYGKVKDGISRDILVPSDMTLQALHYVIQKAFGWIEYSPHNFELNFDEFFQLIQNHVGRWSSFCGLYFRFPFGGDCFSENEEYKGDMSYKNWLKKQYTGPYRYCQIEEHFVESRQLMEQFIEDNPFLKEAVFDVSRNKVLLAETGDECPDLKTTDLTMGFDWAYINDLLERLSLGEVLFPRGSSLDEKTLEKLLSLKWTSKEMDPEVVPITDSIWYQYWSGWSILITCLEQYDIHYGVPGFEDKMEKLQKAPICISYDGLPLVDDVSDIGYCKFLEALHSNDESERKSEREWAREMGWTGYMVKSENLI